MKIYVVVKDVVFDYDSDIAVVAAFPYKEDAIKRMKNEWEEFLKEDWSEMCDERDEGRVYCDAWQDGWASCYHFYVRVEEVEYYE